MRQRVNFMLAATAIAGVAISAANPAMAACTRLAFSVNDYGKIGPTNDAKNLLDKFIAKTMAEKGVTAYKTGKKTVNCELYLDVILFDEYTCKAEATVCWGDSTLPKSEQQAASPVSESKPASSKTTTGSIDKKTNSETTADTAAQSKPDVEPKSEPAAKAAAASPVDEAPTATPAPAPAAVEVAPAPSVPAAPADKRVEVYEKLPAPPPGADATTSPASATATPVEPAEDAVVAPSPADAP